MTTLEIHEPEIKDARPAATGSAAATSPNGLVLGPPLPPRIIFSDSVLEFGVQRKRKFFATTTSFIVNGLILATLLLLPLAFTDELPKAQLLTFLVAPPPPPPPPPPPDAAPVQKIVHKIQTDVLATGELRTPTKIPRKIEMIKEDEAPPPMTASGGVVGGVPGGIPGGQLGGVIGGIVNSTSNLSGVPKLAPTGPHRVRVSGGVTKGMMLHRQNPTYPPLARAARVQGDVVLRAIIDTNGQIQNLEVVTGHPLLVPAALAAVKQWRYKPYLLNDQPVEVETTITVTFVFTN